MKTYLQIGLLCLACSAGAQGTSEEGVVNFSSTISGYIQGTSGWTFKPKEALVVGQLGAFTNVVDQGSVTVGIWSSSGTLLRSVSVGATDELRNRSYYATIQPLLLDASTTYHLGVFSASGSVFMNVFDPLAAPTDTASLSSWIILGGLAQGMSGFSFPAAVAQGEGAMYLGPNFAFFPVPEPGCAALLGVAAGCYFLRRRVFDRK